MMGASLLKDPVPGRTDQDLVDAYMGRHVRNKGNRAAQVVRLKHFCHDLFARRHGPLLHDVGRDLTRAYHGRSNSVLILLDIELMRERDDRGFRSRVGGADQIGDMPASPGRDVDDTSILLFDHCGQNCLYAVYETVQIDVDDAVPSVGGHAFPASVGNVQARTVDQYVDPFVLLQYLGGGVADLLDVLHIEDNLVHGYAALAANGIGGPAQYIRATSGDHDLPPLFRKAGRPRQSDARAPSGNPRNPLRWTVHTDLPLLRAIENAFKGINHPTKIAWPGFTLRDVPYYNLLQCACKVKPNVRYVCQNSNGWTALGRRIEVANLFRPVPTLRKRKSRRPSGRTD